jgi:hypothetical protein
MDDTSLSEEQKSLVYSQELVRKFSHKLAWNELTKVIEYSLGFVIHEKDMSCDQKRYLAKKISNYVIDFTDTIYLPDGFSDPIFKKISNTIIDIIIGD